MNSDEWVESIERSASHAGWLDTAVQAISQCPSVDVWCKYAELLSREITGAAPCSSTEPNRALSGVPNLRDGIQQVGLWLDSSHRLWEYYIAALKRKESEDVVLQAYIERLAVPHLAIDDTYTELSTYVSANANYEDIMRKASTVRAKAYKFLTERERWELSKPVQYEAYLDWELERFSPNARFDFCVPLFNRILTTDPTASPTLWVRFVRHMWFYHSAQATSCAERALKYFPSDTRLWTLYIRILCDQSDRESVPHAMKQAKSAGVQLDKVPDLLNTYCAWLAATSPITGNTLRELRLLVEPIIFSPYVSMDQLATLTLVLGKAHEVEIARKAWRKQSAANKHDAQFWEGWIAFELGLDGREKAAGFAKLWNIYLRHCRVDEHPFVRRQVQRILTANSSIIEAEKLGALGETTVWVSWRQGDWNEANVRSELLEFGPIRAIRHPHNKNFCYVQFETHDAAYRAETVGVSGLSIKLSDRPLKAHLPSLPLGSHHDDQNEAQRPVKRAHVSDNTLVFRGMQDAGDRDHVKQLVARYEAIEVKELDSPSLALEVSFGLDANSGRAQLALNQTPLPSGCTLDVSYI